MDRGTRGAVAAAYAAQGLGYATVVTCLPALKDRHDVDDAFISGLLVAVCVAAALGSVLAGVVARRRGSDRALAAGLLVQAAALAVAATAPGLGVFLAATVVYAVGLGAVDAATNMQGVLLERLGGTPLLGRFYAGYTAAAIVGALATAGVGAVGAYPLLSPLLAALVQAGVGLLGLGLLVRGLSFARADRTPGVATPAVVPAVVPGTPGAGTRVRMPAGTVAIGALVLVAFVVDSAVSTWSTVLIDDTLGAAAGIAPLGYAAYQAAVLTSRLLTDRLVRRWGRGPVALGGLATGVVGCAVVAASGTIAGAVVGFAAAGVAAGTLVPIAFGAAGALDPDRSDAVVARVNLFNYAGVVLGAASLGLLAEGTGLAAAFALPAVLLLLAVPLARRTARA
ncbi:MFS transporter [Nocardioides zeae]|uniref:MFS transporter n=1 Tax=Nocardioides imazamoxiresistens TaxID=3231893 RepID=A0ABU3PVK7_9ACTN|nr:MFS transporter [Nocardioides zeae]MDT9592911.1 MFS transporter [Nocardioides zeae]